MKKAGIVGLGMAALALGVAALLRQGEGAPEKMSGGTSGRTISTSVKSAMSTTGSGSRLAALRLLRKPPKPVLDLGDDDDEDDKRTPEEKALAERIEKALDEEDFKAAVACAEEAQKCAVPEIRQSMVETLGWFGEKALPELTPFLADEDEDVRERAKSEWSMALSSIEDDGVKIRTVELAMHVLKDEDALEDMSGEYIGVDEKLAVESLSRIIAAGGSEEGIAKAKETYEFVTGDEWTSAEEAARWIAEEYTPPEKE